MVRRPERRFSRRSHHRSVLRTLGLITRKWSARSATSWLNEHDVSRFVDEAVFHADHLRPGILDRTTEQTS